MQEHVTKVELYGKLAEMPSSLTQSVRWEGLTVKIRRNPSTGTRTFMILEQEGAILAKFEVLDIDGEYSSVDKNGI